MCLEKANISRNNCRDSISGAGNVVDNVSLFSLCEYSASLEKHFKPMSSWMERDKNCGGTLKSYLKVGEFLSGDFKHISRSTINNNIN
jgi:hypothetical protein